MPINFRLVGAEIRYIVENCEARAFIVQDELMEVVESVRAALPVPPHNYIAIGGAARPNYRGYEELLAAAKDSRPDVAVDGDDPWTLMYTSGTTGKPKGAVRNHRGGAMLVAGDRGRTGIEPRTTRRCW